MVKPGAPLGYVHKGSYRTIECGLNRFAHNLQINDPIKTESCSKYHLISRLKGSTLQIHQTKVHANV